MMCLSIFWAKRHKFQCSGFKAKGVWCVCVCEREIVGKRERQRDRQTGREERERERESKVEKMQSFQVLFIKMLTLL